MSKSETEYMYYVTPEGLRVRKRKKNLDLEIYTSSMSYLAGGFSGHRKIEKEEHLDDLIPKEDAFRNGIYRIFYKNVLMGKTYSGVGKNEHEAVMMMIRRMFPRNKVPTGIKAEAIAKKIMDDCIISKFRQTESIGNSKIWRN